MTERETSSVSREAFARRGYVVLEGVLDDGEIEAYVDALRGVGAGRRKRSWTLPDGVTANEAFWPAIFNARLLAVLHDVLGPKIAFLQHDDLHLGYSSFAWHRDSINRQYGESLPDWREEDAPYLLARCGFYLQPESHGFHLGVIPGSHRPSGLLSLEAFLECDRHLSNARNVGAKLGLGSYLNDRAEWIPTRPGTCIVFDPRLIHTGGRFEAEKYSFFTAYGVVNEHFERHYTYYRHLRRDLHYAPLPSGLVEGLRDADLYAEERQYVSTIDGAWIPSGGYSLVARLFE